MRIWTKKKPVLPPEIKKEPKQWNLNEIYNTSITIDDDGVVRVCITTNTAAKYANGDETLVEGASWVHGIESLSKFIGILNGYKDAAEKLRDSIADKKKKEEVNDSRMVADNSVPSNNGALV